MQDRRAVEAAFTCGDLPVLGERLSVFNGHFEISLKYDRSLDEKV